MDKAIQAPEGIGIRAPAGADIAQIARQLQQLQSELGGLGWCRTEVLGAGADRILNLRLRRSAFTRLAAGFDTLALRRRLMKACSIQAADMLLRETWVALLCAPARIDFEDLEALQSHLRIRCNIARAAQKTALAFKTDAAERPAEFWHDEPGVGFLLKPGACLIDALVAATQPERTGRLYDFSCYRATEYVILLGIAQEARVSAPRLHAALEATARSACIKSGRFHDVFLVEYGSSDAPVPARYYVPGDRVWFKNPDEHSSNAPGYEGSWVIYLGGGRFSNFWKRDAPYSLPGKALEVYHWRDGAYLDDASTVRMDEARVEARVARTRIDPVERRRVLQRMCRYRDPMGVYAEGGCMDATREFPRPLGNIELPLAAAPA